VYYNYIQEESKTYLVGGAENASTGKRKYESAGVENASTENASTMQTFSQIKKTLVLHKLLHFQVGWASGLQIVFSEIT